jgi:hypothetical protein
MGIGGQTFGYGLLRPWLTLTCVTGLPRRIVEAGRDSI